MTRKVAGPREATERLTLRERLDVGIGAMQLALTDAVCERLVDYLVLLERWNRAFNLVAPGDTASMVERHILDSLAPLPWLDEHVSADARALDLGTGAGLPGMVLAIARPRSALDSAGRQRQEDPVLPSGGSRARARASSGRAGQGGASTVRRPALTWCSAARLPTCRSLPASQRRCWRQADGSSP